MSLEYVDVAYLEQQDFQGKKLIANGLNKYVFVKIWASWCGHCKKAHPEFQPLTEIYKSDNNVSIACIQADGTKDSEKELGKNIKQIIDGFRGFPTFVLYKDGNLFKTYEGARKTEDFKDFIDKNTK